MKPLLTAESWAGKREPCDKELRARIKEFRMYSVLVADDEPRHLRGLVEMIKRLRPAYSVTETADGELATEIVRGRPIDLAITDIRMPRKDGLEFLEEVTAVFPRTKVIILSGYADFAYAQKALRLGAIDYVLKPVNESIVERMLRKAEEKLESEKSAHRDAVPVPMVAEHSAPADLDQELNRLIRNGPAACDVAEIAKALGSDGPGRVVVHKIGFSKVPSADREAKDAAERKDSFRNAVAASFGPSLSFFDEADDRLLVTLLPADGTDHALQKTAARLRAFQARSAAERGLDSIAGVGCEFGSGFREITESFQSAAAALEQGFYLQDRKIFTHEENMPKDRPRVSVKYADEVELFDAVKRTDEGEARRVVRRLLDDLRRDHFPRPSELKQEIARVILDAAKASRNFISENEYSLLTEGIKQKIDGIERYGELREAIEEAIEATIAAMRIGRNGKHKKIVDSCRKYVEEHYTRDLSLMMMAEMHGFTSYYFGILFKNETGMTFSEYLRDIRMKRAKELLKDIDRKIYEIAKETGYNDPKYFIRIFKQTYGIAPDEFRKSIHCE
jgi:two-component system, response regulator YesN